MVDFQWRPAFFLQKVGWTKTVPTNNSRNFIQPSMRWLSHQLYPERAGDLGKWFKFCCPPWPKRKCKKTRFLEVFGEVGSRPIQHMHLNSRSKSKHNITNVYKAEGYDIRMSLSMTNTASTIKWNWGCFPVIWTMYKSHLIDLCFLTPCL